MWRCGTVSPPSMPLLMTSRKPLSANPSFRAIRAATTIMCPSTGASSSTASPRRAITCFGTIRI